MAMGSVAGLPEARLWRRRWRKGRDKRGGVKRATSASRAGLRRGASWDPFHNRPTPGASRHMHTINTHTHEGGLGHVRQPRQGGCSLSAAYRLGGAARSLCPRSCRRHAPHTRAAARGGTRTPHETRAAPLGLAAGGALWGGLGQAVGGWREDGPSAQLPRGAPVSPPRWLVSPCVLVPRGPVHALDGRPRQGSACSGTSTHTHTHIHSVKATRRG